MIFIISYKKNLLILRNESLVVLSNGSNGHVVVFESNLENTETDDKY